MKINNSKHLFIYRSFLFKSTKFTTDNKDLKPIITALNIKKRKQRILYVYDEAIKEINEYYKEDLCQFKNGKCIAQRHNDKINGCCRLCPHVTNKGCPSANIACKLLYCKTALKNTKQLKLKDIQILKCLSPLQRLTIKADFFELKETVVFDLYYGIIMAGFRMCYKELKRGTKNIIEVGK